MVHVVGVLTLLIGMILLCRHSLHDTQLLMDLEGIAVFVLMVYCVLRLYGVKLAFVAQW